MRLFYKLKYSIWYLIRYDIPYFFLNIFRFRKTLWKYRSWDWVGFYQAMYDSLEGMEEQQRVYGRSVNAQKYAKDIKICLHLLNRLMDDDYGIRGYRFVENENSNWISGEFVSLHSEQPEYKHGWKIRHSVQNYDRELLFKLMAKHSQSWWD